MLELEEEQDRLENLEDEAASHRRALAAARAELQRADEALRGYPAMREGIDQEHAELRERIGAADLAVRQLYCGERDLANDRSECHGQITHLQGAFDDAVLGAEVWLVRGFVGGSGSRVLCLVRVPVKGRRARAFVGGARQEIAASDCFACPAFFCAPQLLSSDCPFNSRARGTPATPQRTAMCAQTSSTGSAARASSACARSSGCSRA